MTDVIDELTRINNELDSISYDIIKIQLKDRLVDKLQSMPIDIFKIFEDSVKEAKKLRGED